ncbi:S9 family peptidase [Plebeiibacterium marinum]|uniref:S9 family peptidase n=1 Tax=Plebeiibacterium marinum TaxID=2992111 RepID=A0AAE3MHX0_9BACT|nr:DPP IV N-terminal domain-containing protein [Plebeiobacterium marinum]MCW3807957.1 S9 family peptidase [Plebeiobacterium marinum]
MLDILFSKKGIFLLLFCAGILGTEAVCSQGMDAKYKRYNEFKELTKNKVLHGYFKPVWIKNTHTFWYEVLTESGKKYYVVNADQHKKKEVLDENKLLANLSGLTNKQVKAEEIDHLKINDDLKSFQFVYGNHIWEGSLSSNKLSKQEVYQKPQPFNWTMAQPDQTINEPVTSPDGKWLGFIRDYNLFVRDIKTNNEIQLSYDGGLGLYYSSYIQWSPDSKSVMAYLVQPADKHFVNYIESSPLSQKQPVYSSIEYYKPGDALPQFYPCIFNIEKKKLVASGRAYIPNQYSVENIDWNSDGGSLTFEYNQRGHQVYQVIKMDAVSGEVKVVIDETSETFIDYSSKKYRYNVNDGNEIIWASERDGWNHLYLYDGNTGKVVNQITKGNWVVRNVVHVDEGERKIIFAASGKEEGDPYLLHYYSVDFNGNNLKHLTPGNGNHRLSFSSDYTSFVDSWSRVDLPPVTVLRDAESGDELMQLEKSDISKLQETGWEMPEVFVSKGRDDKTDIWGMILKPSNFDPSKTYPVIEYIYAGPHSNHVPKDFRAHYNRCRSSLTELGFVVVMIDGMGTSNRSKAFHDVCWKNLKDAGFPDRIKWMKSAAEKYAYMDISKVGIYGKSAGGQNSTGAVLFYPEFYKVAASVCGCHDNRMDKIWWNEQWMGWPVGPEYAACSNVDNAYRLKGDLFLIVGEMDQNVDPTSTYQVADALIKANKDFDLMLLPGKGHEWGGEYGERRICNYFVDKIMQQKAPVMNQIEFEGSLIKKDIDIDN